MPQQRRAPERRLGGVARHLNAAGSGKPSDEPVPEAFLPATVRANSEKEQWLYGEFHTNREPQASLYRLNMTTHRDAETGGINPNNTTHNLEPAMVIVEVVNAVVVCATSSASVVNRRMGWAVWSGSKLTRR